MKVSEKRKQFYEVEITFNQGEIQSLLSVFEQIGYIMQRPSNEFGGMRQEIYDKLRAVENHIDHTPE